MSKVSHYPYPSFMIKDAVDGIATCANCGCDFHEDDDVEGLDGLIFCSEKCFTDWKGAHHESR